MINFMRPKNNQSMSQKLRSRIWIRHSQIGFNMDFDNYYQNKIKKLISYWDEIDHYLDKKS